MTRHQRRTFNLQVVEIGWASSLLIYPSLPKYVDLEMFYAVGKMPSRTTSVPGLIR